MNTAKFLRTALIYRIRPVTASESYNSHLSSSLLLLCRPIRGHPLSTYVKLSEKLTFLTPRHALPCVYQGVRNVSFSENVAYVLNGWPLRLICYQHEKDLLGLCEYL